MKNKRATVVFEKNILMKLVNSAVLVIPGLEHIIIAGSFATAYVRLIWKTKDEFFLMPIRQSKYFSTHI